MPATMDEIREWGDANGWDISGTHLPRGLRAAYESRDNVASDEEEETPVWDAATSSHGYPEYPGAEAFAVPDDHEGMNEIPPVIKEPTAREKASRFVDRVKKAAPPVRARKVRKPRVSTGKLIAMGWRGLAQMMAPINLPVARVLDMQAPVAGDILEDVVRDTVVDRLLQPLARANEGGEAVFALLGPPLLVAAMTSKPEVAPVLVPVLKEALRRWIDIAGPKLAEHQKKEEAFQEKYGTRIDDMIAMFLMPADADFPMSAPSENNAR